MEDTFRSLKGSPFNKVRLFLFPKHYNCNRNAPELYPFEKTKIVWWAKGGAPEGESAPRIAFLRDLVESLPRACRAAELFPAGRL